MQTRPSVSTPLIPLSWSLNWTVKIKTARGGLNNDSRFQLLLTKLLPSNKPGDSGPIVVHAQHEPCSRTAPAHVASEREQRRVHEWTGRKTSRVQPLPDELCWSIKEYSLLNIVILQPGEWQAFFVIFDSKFLSSLQNDWNTYLSPVTSSNGHDTKTLSSLPVMTQPGRGRPSQQHLPASQSLSASKSHKNPFYVLKSQQQIHRWVIMSASVISWPPYKAENPEMNDDHQI